MKPQRVQRKFGPNTGTHLEQTSKELKKVKGPLQNNFRASLQKFTEKTNENAMEALRQALTASRLSSIHWDMKQLKPNDQDQLIETLIREASNLGFSDVSRESLREALGFPNTAKAVTTKPLANEIPPTQRERMGGVPKAIDVNTTPLPDLKPGDQISLKDPRAKEIINKYFKPGDLCKIFVLAGGFTIITFQGIRKGDVLRDNFYFLSADNKLHYFPIPFPVTIELLDQASLATQAELKPGDEIDIWSNSADVINQLKKLKRGDTCELIAGEHTQTCTFQELKKDGIYLNDHYHISIPWPGKLKLVKKA